MSDALVQELESLKLATQKGGPTVVKWWASRCAALERRLREAEAGARPTLVLRAHDVAELRLQNAELLGVLKRRSNEIERLKAKLQRRGFQA